MLQYTRFKSVFTNESDRSGEKDADKRFLEAFMRIKKGFVLEKVGDSYLCCATGKLAKEFSGFVRLNETGAFLWNILASGDVTKEDILAKMTAEYDVSPEIALADIDKFLDNLEKNGIIQ